MPTSIEVLQDYGALPRSYKGGGTLLGILSCLKCAFAQAGKENFTVNGSDIARCTGASQSYVATSLRRLERARVLEAKGRHVRGSAILPYTIADTPVGNALRASLMGEEPVATCPMAINSENDVEITIAPASEPSLPER